MRRALFLLFSFSSPLFGCGGSSETNIDGDAGATDVVDTEAGGEPDAGGDASMPIHSASKVDLLLAIDNSASMGDKQLLLAKAVTDLVNGFVNPNCVDATGNVVGTSSAGTCAQGKPEFPPVQDMHIGIVTSSLGGRGADICDGTAPTGAGATRHDNDDGQLINRASSISGTSIDPSEHPTPDIGSSNFLAFSPQSSVSIERVVADFQEAVAGVHEYGCGLEAQLESWYRFLVQPDPYALISRDPGNTFKRVLTGTNATILQQRHDFLRPDSLVAIVLLSDEDDSAPDPRAVIGEGSAYSAQRFPGSVGGGAARATSACDSLATVNTTACTSCAFPGHTTDPNCQLPGDIDSTTGKPQLGYYPAAVDTLNIRYMRMKQRYGVDPQFPVQRYVDGLTSRLVPDRTGELYDGVGSDGLPNDTYRANPACTNPLFATSLPTAASAELCHLVSGPRTSDLVIFAAITGVPWQLLTENPADPASPFKASLSPADWTKLVGANPAKYDYTGQDPHMVQSVGPRAGLPTPAASDTADPIHGREWDTSNSDMQYACTFPLLAPKDCKDPKFAGACDCPLAGPRPPLCDPATPTTQIRGRAYPSLRELQVVRGLGNQGIVGSICPRSIDPASPDFAYRPAIRSLLARARLNLAAR